MEFFRSCRLRRLLTVAAVTCALSLLLAAIMPLPRAISDPQPRAPVRLLDRGGRLLYEARQDDFGSQRPLALSEIPEKIIEGLIAVEDRTFWSHMGVSMRGVLRAIVLNLSEGRIVSGGSTITQQLVSVRLHSGRRTLLSKLREMWLALKVDAVYSKEEILEEYVNSVYFGHQAYGLQSASFVYFGKELRELSIAETAMLIGIIQSPVALDPFRDLPSSTARRDRVLAAMDDFGVIDAAEAERARSEPVRLASDRIAIEAPHFAFFALGQVEGETPPGSFVRTTLDLDLQHEVQRIVDRRLEELLGKNATSAAVVVLDARSGDILAMVGSADYFDAARDGAVNVTVSARQPGSALKPFTYALALAQGDTAATTVADTEIRLLTGEGNPYTPRNYDYDLHGLVRYREALANSYNISAVKVLERVGVQKLLNFLRQAGMTTFTRNPEFYGLALTLGSGEVRLLELAQAYGIFPRGGRTLIARALVDSPVQPGEQILDPRVAWIIADILSDASARLPEFGEETPLDVPPHVVAAKTGTTRNARDNWVVGFTPDRIVGVWVGNADNTPMEGTSGITGAGPIFHDAMDAALRGLPASPFPRPEGIADIEICTLSGKLPTELCPYTMREVFVSGTEPREFDDMYQRIEERLYVVFPEELRPWAREHGYEDPPGEGGERGALTITHPAHGDTFLLDPLIPDLDERITLGARAGVEITEVRWWVNGEFLGTGFAPDFRVRFPPLPGVHSIVARAGVQEDRIVIDVLDVRAQNDE